jgi:hypothetical protein
LRKLKINQENYLPSIHKVVDDWVDHGVGHGEPVESEVDVLNSWTGNNIFVVICVEKVAMIWKPTQSEHDNNRDKHFHKL